MTEEQKEILIAKMLEAPSSLSDEDLDAILHDDEMRDIYSASSAISNAFTLQPELDMKAEWNRFSPRLRHKPVAMRWVMRVAVVFSGVILASGIAVKIIDNAFISDRHSVIAEAKHSQELKTTPDAQSDSQETAPDEGTKRIQTISGINSISNHLAKAEIDKPQNATDQMVADIDIDEYLRIQQARIDNELALQEAEYYIDEYYDLVPILDAAGVHNPELENAIRMVTME